jgi:hypothetical protein
VWLDFDARPDDGYCGHTVEIDSLDLPHAGDVAVELDCDVIARLAEGFIGGRLRFENAAGATVRVGCLE